MASPEAVVRRYYLEKLLLKVKQNSQENIRAGSACNFINKRLRHKYFPVKFAKFLRTPMLKSICERLLLHLKYYIQQQATLQKI